MAKETDKYSDRYLQLEQEISNLRKRVIDLDFEHKLLCSNKLKESRQKQEEERDRALKEAEEEREKRKREIEERLEKEKQER